MTVGSTADNREAAHRRGTDQRQATGMGIDNPGGDDDSARRQPQFSPGAALKAPAAEPSGKTRGGTLPSKSPSPTAPSKLSLKRSSCAR